ncbi:hypothetical protein [Algoriphagus antarcticus]|uniref:Uncharacterized protein n=1 Tax=Algoriphagus antarcticus TaxID=238540 RepID=A0A3E0D5R5_9BACT|nr:hypothetical protein [Algoriphagus antarcticus]REG76888.1 hypothetical protein C8N25_1546 [Algoriphagus antarcticus]
MNNHILFLLFLTFLTISPQDRGIKVNLIPTFVENQEKKYSIIYSVQTNTDGTKQIINKTKKQVDIKVISIHDDIIDMQWKYTDIEFIESTYINNPFTALMNTLCAGITIKYSTDKSGVIKSITNRNEISTKLRESIDEKLTLFINENNIDSSKVLATKSQLQMIFSDHSQIDKIIIGDLFKFHQLYGNEYSEQPTKIIVNSDIWLESHEVVLKSIDKSNQTCLLLSNLVNDSSKEINGSFEYNLSDYWLINHRSQIASFTPLDVMQFYQIQQLP